MKHILEQFQESLQIMQQIIGQHPDSHIVIGAIGLAVFFLLTRDRKDSRYRIESSHLTTGWWEATRKANRRIS